MALALALLKQTAPTLSLLFTRLRDEDVAEHPVRSGILRLLAHGPMLLADLVSGLGHKAGRIRHHVAVLRQAGHVVEVKFLGRTVLVVAGTAPATVLEGLVKREPRLLAVHEAKEAGLERAVAVRLLADRFGVVERTARKYFQTYESLDLNAHGGHEWQA